MDNTEKIRRKYDRAAKLYDIINRLTKLISLKKCRSEVAQGLNGIVLEVGVDTGMKIPYYPEFALE